MAKAIPVTEVRKRLERLPCVFRGMRLYFKLEVLEETKAERWCEFEATGCEGLARA